MPKLDPTDPASTPAAPLVATVTPQPPTFGTSSTSTAPGAGANGFGTAGTTTPASTGFSSASSGGFGSSGSSGGFGSSGSSGGFGSSGSSGGFGSSGSSGGFGGSGSSGGFGGSSSFSGSSMGGMAQPGMGMPNSQAASLQSTGGAMQEGGTAAIETSKGFGDFINSKWRPMMAVIYMVTCTTDFVIFPILWSLLQAISHGQVTSQWQPLTLQGAGLYHIAMGAVLGLAAYGRSQEKIAGKA